MAAPNIVNVSTITCKTTVQNANTSLSTMVINAASSGQVFKINMLLATNKSATAADVTVDIYRGATSYPLAYTITVPDKAAVVLSGKDTAFYLEEGDVLRISSSINSSIVVTTSYEIIS